MVYYVWEGSLSFIRRFLDITCIYGKNSFQSKRDLKVYFISHDFTNGILWLVCGKDVLWGMVSHGYYWFENCALLIGVTPSDNVINIRVAAYKNCTSFLTCRYIELESQLISISDVIRTGKTSNSIALRWLADDPPLRRINQRNKLEVSIHNEK